MYALLKAFEMNLNENGSIIGYHAMWQTLLCDHIV